MDVLLEMVLFVIGGAFCVWWFNVIILPIFYGLPKSLYWTAKGVLKARSALLYLKTFLLWSTLFIFSALILINFFPKAVKYLYNSWGFYLGQWFGIIVSMIKAFSKSGRKILQEDFWAAMARFHKGKTPNNHMEPSA